ncbi:retrotransposon protein, putative, ty1-copia subclass [Tanacetum coccineum]|uniref:Retrotransposon protein, putative, ty1-copia subclass n=1 Tax=Tanacetum coccineum TaxID=301880 RepID=A0ABQ5GDA6_9ASTR
MYMKRISREMYGAYAKSYECAVMGIHGLELIMQPQVRDKEGLNGGYFRKLQFRQPSENTDREVKSPAESADEAIRSFDLILPSSLIIVLDNCHFAPIVTRGVVSITRLVNNGYIHTFTNYGISISKDNVFYFTAIPHDGIYEIDMHNLYQNVSSMYNVSNKRAKHALDSSYLWHCRHGHINKKRIDKLQRDGILQSTHDESLKKLSERRNQTLLDMVRSMMNLTTLLKSFWGYVLESAVHILNMVPIKKVDRTPYEIWHGKAPKLSYLRVWDCEALVKRDAHEKLDSISIKYIFIGNPKETMGYYFYYPLENKNFVALNAEFFENSFMVQEVSGSHGLLEMSESDKGLELIQVEDTQPSENTSEVHNEVTPIEVKPKVLKFLFVDPQGYLKYQIDMDTMLILRSMN